jgi:hypothetical protein
MYVYNLFVHLSTRLIDGGFEAQETWTKQEVKQMMHLLKERGACSINTVVLKWNADPNTGSSAFIDEYVRLRNIPIHKLLEAFDVELASPFSILPCRARNNMQRSAQSSGTGNPKRCSTSCAWRCRTGMSALHFAFFVYCSPRHMSVLTRRSLPDCGTATSSHNITPSRTQCSSSANRSAFLF